MPYSHGFMLQVLSFLALSSTSFIGKTVYTSSCETAAFTLLRFRDDSSPSSDPPTSEVIVPECFHWLNRQGILPLLPWDYDPQKDTASTLALGHVTGGMPYSHGFVLHVSYLKDAKCFRSNNLLLFTVSCPFD
ncbi:hypothetical protein ISCGN_022256 [Ixodes scapularis]